MTLHKKTTVADRVLTSSDHLCRGDARMDAGGKEGPAATRATATDAGSPPCQGAGHLERKLPASLPGATSSRSAGNDTLLPAETPHSGLTATQDTEAKPGALGSPHGRNWLGFWSRVQLGKELSLHQKLLATEIIASAKKDY